MFLNFAHWVRVNHLGLGGYSKAAAGWCVGDFHAQDLANTAWAFATLGQSNVKLFPALGRAATWCVGDFNVQALANTAWAFAMVAQ